MRFANYKLSIVDLYALQWRLLESRALRLSTLKKISLYLERDFSRNFGDYVILSLGSLTNVLPLCIQMRPLCCPLSGAQWPSDQAAQWFSMAQLRRNSGKVLSTPSKVVAEKKSDVGTSGRCRKKSSSRLCRLEFSFLFYETQQTIRANILLFGVLSFGDLPFGLLSFGL